MEGAPAAPLPLLLQDSEFGVWAAVDAGPDAIDGGLESLLPGDGPGVPCHVAAAYVDLGGRGALAYAALDHPVRGGRAPFLAALLFGCPLLGRCDRCVHGTQAHCMPGPECPETCQIRWKVDHVFDNRRARQEAPLRTWCVPDCGRPRCIPAGGVTPFRAAVGPRPARPAPGAGCSFVSPG